MVALKVAVIAAAATVTEAGAVRVALVLVRVTVQALEELGPRLVGLHVSDETNTATMLIVALAELLL